MITVVLIRTVLSCIMVRVIVVRTESPCKVILSNVMFLNSNHSDHGEPCSNAVILCCDHGDPHSNGVFLNNDHSDPRSNGG
jgi:hypothetical protein